MESVVHSSLHPNCHHQIVFTKFNLKIFERKIWHYSKANTDLTHSQSVSYLGKTDILILMQIKLMKQLRIFHLTL